MEWFVVGDVEEMKVCGWNELWKRAVKGVGDGKGEEWTAGMEVRVGEEEWWRKWNGMRVTGRNGVSGETGVKCGWEIRNDGGIVVCEMGKKKARERNAVRTRRHMKGVGDGNGRKIRSMKGDGGY